jgi:undecaprenyl phosphate N,N'-diacetylbacillosamine 1-phosphate transferase
MVYNRCIKQLFDFVFALIALMITFPIMGLIFILLKIINHKPIIFTQQRPGLNEKVFTLYKFATMTNERDVNGSLLQDELRLTKVGKLLRKTSMDELPQLINIIKGDMSFVGPRPLLVEYLSLYNDEQKLRHTVKPGISGYAQVNGRNNITWKQKLDYDIYYAKNISFLLDIKVIFNTAISMFKTKDIAKVGFATSDKFTGNE